MYRTISPLILALSFLLSLHHAETEEPVRVIEVHARRFAFEPSPWGKTRMVITTGALRHHHYLSQTFFETVPA